MFLAIVVANKSEAAPPPPISALPHQSSFASVFTSGVRRTSVPLIPQMCKAASILSAHHQALSAGPGSLRCDHRMLTLLSRVVL